MLMQEPAIVDPRVDLDRNDVSDDCWESAVADEARFGEDDPVMKMWVGYLMENFPNMGPAGIARQREMARMTFIEHQLPSMSMNEFEELKKKWAADLEIGLDKTKTLRFSKLALEFYNAENGTDFVLVHAKISRMVFLWGRRDMLAHVNFKAKKPNDEDEDAVLFFAELLYHGESPSDVISCTILDATIPIQLECYRCHPGSKIQHPVGLFDPDCQRPSPCKDRWTKYYLARAGIDFCG